MPTPRLVYLLQKRFNTNHSDVGTKIVEYVNSFQSGYFKDVNSIDWNQLYDNKLTLEQAVVFAQFRYSDKIITQFQNKPICPNLIKLYTIALQNIDTSNLDYSELQTHLRGMIVNQLQNEELTELVQKMAYFYVKKFEVDFEIVENLFSSIQISSQVFPVISICCDDYRIAQQVTQSQLELLVPFLTQNNTFQEAMDILAVISYRRQNLSIIFDSGIFMKTTFFAQNDVHGFMWLIANSATSYKHYFTETTLKFIIQSLNSADVKLVKYASISLEEMSFNVDDSLREFMEDNEVFASVYQCCRRYINEIVILNHLLGFIKGVVLEQIIELDDILEFLEEIQQSGDSQMRLVSQMINDVM